MLPIALLCGYLTVWVNEEPSINVVLTLLGLNDFSTKERERERETFTGAGALL